ncbi:MAG: hypothetical protein ACI8R4_001614, partial [Paracoccaceae bacterium]
PSCAVLSFDHSRQIKYLLHADKLIPVHHQLPPQVQPARLAGGEQGVVGDTVQLFYMGQAQNAAMHFHPGKAQRILLDRGQPLTQCLLGGQVIALVLVKGFLVKNAGAFAAPQG